MFAQSQTYRPNIWVRLFVADKWKLTIDRGIAIVSVLATKVLRAWISLL